MYHIIKEQQGLCDKRHAVVLLKPKGKQTNGKDLSLRTRWITMMSL